jgi:hypothetical protein
MPRNLPGTIKREAPPGPTMTEAEFKAALETQTHDAARWRCLMLHWSTIFADALEDCTPPSNADIRRIVDLRRGAKV